MLFVELLGLVATVLVLEDEVLDQVYGVQRSPAVVERLEDDLCVVAVVEVNPDDVQLCAHDSFECSEVQLSIRVGELFRPFTDRALKEAEGAHDPVFLEVMINSAVGHNSPEGGAIVLGRPDLEHRIGLALREVRAVLDQITEDVCLLGRSELPEGRRSRSDEQLNRSKPLLAVDDLAKLELTSTERNQFNDDSPEKVNRQLVATRGCSSSLGRFNIGLDNLEDIAPEWFPLALALPGVAPLEDRNDVPDIPAEDRVKGLSSRVDTAIQSRGGSLVHEARSGAKTGAGICMSRSSGSRRRTSRRCAGAAFSEMVGQRVRIQGKTDRRSPASPGRAARP